MMVLRVERRGHFVARLPEWIGAGTLFLLGAQLGRPECSFGLSHIYDILARMASERDWALIALILSTTRLVALILNGFFPVIRRITPSVRCITAFAGGCIWSAITVGFMMENNSILGIIAHMGWAALDFTYAVVVAQEAACHVRGAMDAARKP